VHPHIANGRSSAGSIHSLGQVPPEKSRKPSQHISKRQTTNLVAAFEFAETIGLPLNVSADIAWIFFAGIADDRTRFARCQQRLSKWALRHGFPLTMIWTREVGKNGSPHTHVLLHVPPHLIQDKTFQQVLDRSFEPEGGPVHDKAILIQTAYKPLGKLLYNLKGTDPKHASDFNIRPAYQGFLSGKRAGFTQNLGPGARRKSHTREVEQPRIYPSDDKPSSCKTGMNPGSASNTEQTQASKFSSDNAPEGVPSVDRRTEPPEDVIAAAIEFYKKDTRGRWHVRPPDAERLRNGPFAWRISYAEVERLLRLIWPGYLARIRRIANEKYGGDLGRVPASWQISLETALDREADARRDFGRRRQKWKEQRKWSEDLRRRRMPAEQRRELERKEHDVRMRAIYAELDERGKAYAARAMLEVISHIRHGRIDRVQHLIAGIAEISEGITASDIASLVVPREAHLLPPEQRDRWGNQIILALSEQGFLL
jgi:hypothetical protein